MYQGLVNFFIVCEAKGTYKLRRSSLVSGVRQEEQGTTRARMEKPPKGDGEEHNCGKGDKPGRESFSDQVKLSHKQDD